MVYSELYNLDKYVSTDLFEYIKDFLKSVDENTEEKLYELNGEDIFARVMSYNTPPPKECEIEAHNKYIDIQSTIVGAEGISIFERSKLIEVRPYLEEKDVALFEYREDALRAHTINVPGYFTMLFPEDAHRPQEFVRGYGHVKKYVIKIKVQEET